MADLNSYLEARALVERRHREYCRAEGARDALLARLREEFGCDSYQKAVRLLKKERERLEELTLREEQLLEAFHKEFSRRLGE